MANVYCSTTQVNNELTALACTNTAVIDATWLTQRIGEQSAYIDAALPSYAGFGSTTAAPFLIQRACIFGVVQDALNALGIQRRDGAQETTYGVERDKILDNIRTGKFKIAAYDAGDAVSFTECTRDDNET
jgi:hypothetical protein